MTGRDDAVLGNEDQVEEGQRRKSDGIDGLGSLFGSGGVDDGDGRIVAWRGT